MFSDFTWKKSFAQLNGGGGGGGGGGLVGGGPCPLSIWPCEMTIGW